MSRQNHNHLSLQSKASALQVPSLSQAGADIIEIGIPYTDPLADGPTIQAASARALQGGAGVDESLRAIGRASSTVSCPIVVLAYYNTVLQRGFGRFASRLKACGASGLLIPDVPLEEAGAIRGECELRGVELSLLATPATPDERLKLISSASSGFVYLVAVTGVTGERKEVSAELPGVLKRLKSVCELPIAVGFGVSAPEHAAQLAGLGADGVIVGSALVKRLGEAPSVDEGLASMSELASSIHSGIPDPASAP